MNPCPLCHVGERSAGTTTITLTRGAATIVIRQVPAHVCSTCGEASLDSETALDLEPLAEQMIASGGRVVDYHTQPYGVPDEENPEWTAEEIRTAKPFAEMFPDIAAATRRSRGPQ